MHGRSSAMADMADILLIAVADITPIAVADITPIARRQRYAYNRTPTVAARLLRHHGRYG